MDRGGYLQWTTGYGKLQNPQKELDHGGKSTGFLFVVQEDHDWISEFSLALQESPNLKALNCDIDVPCVVRGSMLWFSAPTSLNNDLLNDGVLFAVTDTINLAFRGSFILPFWRRNTPRACSMRSIRATLVWPPEMEMNGWELGGRPDLLLEHGNDGQDIEPEVS